MSAADPTPAVMIDRMRMWLLDALTKSLDATAEKGSIVEALLNLKSIVDDLEVELNERNQLDDPIPFVPTEQETH